MCDCSWQSSLNHINHKKNCFIVLCIELTCSETSVELQIIHYQLYYLNWYNILKNSSLLLFIFGFRMKLVIYSLYCAKCLVSGCQPKLPSYLLEFIWKFLLDSTYFFTKLGYFSVVRIFILVFYRLCIWT